MDVLTTMRLSPANVSNKRAKNLCIVGTGYVGLVTGTCFAEVGHRVICVDCDAAKIQTLRNGGVPIYEPGLEEIIKRNVVAGRLQFTSNIAEGVSKSDVIFHSSAHAAFAGWGG
jgi:UDPglucose 6-dehydrogenase